MNYFCCQDRRRDAIAAQVSINGIDFLEVLDNSSLPQSQRQRTLFVHFINPLAPGSLTINNVRIEGGERITKIQVSQVSIGTGPQANLLTVTIAAPGDFSTYTLRLVDGVAGSSNPPAGFDLILSAVDFSFKIACPTDFDCRAIRVCPSTPIEHPAISYLAKDYASFRQLILDRIAVLSPEWQEQNAADFGITLIELLAYAGDYLSYRQDAVATEAYLGTARRRISVRRHARLVDYQLHEGANARTWLQVKVTADTVKAHPTDPSPLPAGTRLLTLIPGQQPRLPTNTPGLDALLAQATAVFETMDPAPAGLYAAHNEIQFYTWGALECCLPKGATRATLAGALTNLKKGDVLLFEEVLGPRTGVSGDADPGHRCTVRLIQDPAVLKDPIGGAFAEPPNTNPVDVTEIQWGSDDALPFPLCISAQLDSEHGGAVKSGISVARGNMVLTDHGLTITKEPLGPVPPPTQFRSLIVADRCNPPAPEPVLPRFRPRLAREPLTQVVPGVDPAAPASSMLTGDPRKALAAIQLHDNTGRSWQLVADLLASDALANDFVVEIDDDGTAQLRFGDDTKGARPLAGTLFSATYRFGNGTAGNIGADQLAHIVSDNSNIARVRNPLPAQGGTQSESIEDVRQRAPTAFRTQQRAVTLEDYAAAAASHPQVQRAAASFRWTGSWRTVFVAVHRLGGLPVDTNFKASMQQYLDQFRLAGYDLEIDDPVFVSLEIEMVVVVQPEHFRADVELALLGVFNNGIEADGTRGVFHPDNFSFGQTVYISPLYAAALRLAGISSVQITKFQRQGKPNTDASATGALSMGRLEIARLDNDPNFPEHGVFNLIMEGGK
jgi:baseplate J-like protein